MSNFIHSSVVHRNAVIRLLWAIWSLLFACRLSLFCFATEIETQFPSPSNSPPWTCSARNRRRRDEPAAASADYGRFSTEFQDETTIESQQESCRNEASKHGQPINPDLEYVDRAISGTKLHREGLDRLLADAKAGRFNRLYFYSLSRLARESIIGMPILKRLVYVYKIRIVSVTEGVDSSREGWELLAQMCLMQHERYIKELSANTFRGQKSNLKNRYSNGDYCFGYTSVPVPGSENTRRGRHARPRMTYAIHPVNSEWVRRVFTWFVHERRSIRWITKELNRRGAPKDHRSKKSKNWHHQYVSRLLANRKYVGDWAWGEMKNVRDPETGLIHQEARSTEEIEQYRRTFAELRLIDDATFAAAQAILVKNREAHAHGRAEEGKFVAGREGAAPPASHLLNGLIVCNQRAEDSVCGRNFHVGGSRGKYMFCPARHEGSCSCQTQLPRRLAEELILQEVSVRILADPDWLRAVFDATRFAWNLRRQTLPNELRDTQKALDEVNRKIDRLVDSLEWDDQPDPDVARRLALRRAERRELETRLAAARQIAAEQPIEPTFEWVCEQVRQLGTVLSGSTPAAAYALRDLLDGPIRVRQIERPGKKRHFLRGTMRIRLAGVITASGMKAAEFATSENVPCEEITIDFIRENPLNAQSEAAKALWDEQLSNKAIARRLGCTPARVTKLLKHWSRRYGVELPDGRSRRGQLPPSPDALPLYRRIAEAVMNLYRQNVELGDIAAALGHDRNTVTAAVRYWHESRGLPVPDGRTRRKSLPRSPEKREGLKQDDPGPDEENEDSSAA
jgi:DNA invertase Pin-like site-specific DNA recombinase